MSYEASDETPRIELKNIREMDHFKVQIALSKPAKGRGIIESCLRRWQVRQQELFEKFGHGRQNVRNEW